MLAYSMATVARQHFWMANHRMTYISRFPLHYVAVYMEQVIENRIGKTVPFGLVAEAMNEPIGPVENVIEKARIHSPRRTSRWTGDGQTNVVPGIITVAVKSYERTGQFCIIIFHLVVLKMFQIYFPVMIFSRV